ncbi:WD repeat-containing protein 60 [Rhizophlyctis rosea]|nr:WD repeat-containing protein 60 [Rhizophlyctis rosea]
MSKTRKTQSIAIPRAKVAEDEYVDLPASSIPPAPIPALQKPSGAKAATAIAPPTAQPTVTKANKENTARKPPPQPVPAPSEPTDDNGGYGDDFEDYEEDFEEFHTNENVPSRALTPASARSIYEEVPLAKDIVDVQRALEAENERASSRQSQRLREKEIELPQDLPKRQIIDLEAAHTKAQKAKAMSLADQRMTKRAKDLQNLIELDIATYDILDLPPLNEYELYIRNYGSSNTVQASTQSNEDLLDRDVQTDDWLVEDKWSQAPADITADVGASLPDLPWAEGRRGKRDEEDGGAGGGGKDKRKRPIVLGSVNVDAVRLIEFLRRSSQVMDVLLEENVKDSGVSGIFQPTASVSISQGVAELGVPSFLADRPVRDIWYSPTDYRLVMAALSKSRRNTTTSPLDDKGVICLWRLSDPSSPYCILTCSPQITTCTFSPTKPTLIFAGTEDGSIQLWDLTEPVSLHPTYKINGTDVRVRRPSYATDGLYTVERAHEAKIVGVMAMHEEGREEGGVQVASVDEGGRSVIETRGEAKELSDVDYGMGIGSKVKLVKSTGVQVKDPDRTAPTPTPQILTTAASHNTFLYGTPTPKILHTNRYHPRPTPRFYRPSPPTLTPTTDPCTSLTFCPHDPRIFLAGYDSGRITLFVSPNQDAERVWIIESGVKVIRWSPHRPAVFFVLDVRGRLHVWDLHESVTGASYVISPSETDRVIHFALSSSTGVVTTKGKGKNAITQSQVNLAAGSTRNATMVLGYESGRFEVHLLEGELAEMAVGEENVLEEFVGEEEG